MHYFFLYYSENKNNWMKPWNAYNEIELSAKRKIKKEKKWRRFLELLLLLLPYYFFSLQMAAHQYTKYAIWKCVVVNILHGI